MIVTCPNCSTKFNLPETQAAPGAKLRCSVCKHVFQLSDGVKPAEIRMEPDLSLSSPSLSMPPKKKGGIWGWVLTLLILCAVAGGTWWAWTYTPLFDTVKEMIAPPKKQDPVELVKNIALRGVRQYNISNEKLGNISVVEGKVVNGFNQPRELIRIEASLYDSAGNALVSKQQLAGTSLSLFQLQVLGEQDIEPLLQAANSDSEDAQSARQELVSMLMDRHGTSRVLFRNTRNGVKGFPKRELHTIKLPLPTQYQTAIKVSGIMGARKSAEDRARDMLYPERIYQEFEGDNATWWNFDPRVEWLMGYLTSHRSQKVLVICAKAATALQLEQVLREREGIRAAVFHEGMSIIERDRAAAWFAEEDTGAQVLLCSEIGSEGRNFQFASHMVMFDLPFNPDLLEQRIGRLDRIGQAHDIQIHVPYLEKTAQSVLVRWYHEGLDAFEHTCPTGRTIYDSVYNDLINYLASPDETEGFDDLIKNCREQHEALKAQLEQGRDRLLEIHSNGGEKAQALAESIEEQDDDTNLIAFAMNLFDIIGINQDDRGDNMIVLTPSDHMLVPDFPGLSEDGITITFDREVALAREDAQFITWEHPLIRNGLDLILSGDTGSSTISLLKNKALPVGTLLVELIYVVEAQAPKQLQLNRFLPPTPVRMLLDKNGNNLAAQVEFETFNRQLNAVNRHTGSKLVNAVQQDVHAILQLGEAQIEKSARALIDAARNEADEKLSAELSRLEALRAVNPNIRDDELTAIESNRQQVMESLDQAGWRLDALRLIVVTHQ